MEDILRFSVVYGTREISSLGSYKGLWICNKTTKPTISTSYYRCFSSHFIQCTIYTYSTFPIDKSLLTTNCERF